MSLNYYNVKSYLDDKLGLPKEGIHSYRIFDIAYVDVISTIIGSIMLAWLFKWNYLRTILGMFLLGIVLHRFFNVRTTIGKLIFS